MNLYRNYYIVTVLHCLYRYVSCKNSVKSLLFYNVFIRYDKTGILWTSGKLLTTYEKKMSLNFGKEIDSIGALCCVKLKKKTDACRELEQMQAPWKKNRPIFLWTYIVARVIFFFFSIFLINMKI